MQVANQESSTLTKLFPILDNKGVNIKKEISEKEFIDKLRTRNGNLKIVLEREEDGCDL